MQDTSVSLGYQLDVPKANLQFKGTTLKMLFLRSLLNLREPSAKSRFTPAVLDLMLESQLQSRCTVIIRGNHGNRLLDVRGFCLLQARWTATG